MRPIKFRGRRIDGSFVYGDLIHYKNGTVAIQIIEGGIYAVVGDTVAQLVGYDAKNKEVYEGDIVIEEYVDGECTENIAHLESMTQVPETAQFFFFPFPAPFTTLKEQSE